MSIVEKIRLYGLVGSASIIVGLVKKKLCKILCGLGTTETGGGYISASETEAAARQAGLTVGDYVERLWGVEGGSKCVIDRIAATGILDHPSVSILEIGVGTGRYMEKVIARVESLTSYESYETNQGWAKYLAKTYPSITTRCADGLSLSETRDHSVDFVHAHGVFVYTPFLTTMRYLQEIGRVLKTGGLFAADFYTEESMTPDLLSRWLASHHQYPAIVPLGYITGFLEMADFVKEDSFFNPHGMGRSHYLVFRKLAQ